MVPPPTQNSSSDPPPTSIGHPVPLRISVADANAMIPLYDGNPDELHRFISCCDSLVICAKSEPDKDLFFTIIKSRLTGAAFDVFKYKDVANWEELKRELIEQFQEERPRSHIQSELMRLRQGYKESIKDFAQRVNKALTELNNSTLQESTDNATRIYVLKENEKLAINTFEDGLKNEQLKVIAKAKGETSLRKLITYITEHSLRMEAQQVNFPRGNGPTVTCTYCNRPGHSADVCFQRKKIPTFIPTQTSHIKREVNRVTCAYCKKPNHHIQDCRSRIYNERMRQQQQQTQLRDLKQVRWSAPRRYPENPLGRGEAPIPSSRVIHTQAEIHSSPLDKN